MSGYYRIFPNPANEYLNIEVVNEGATFSIVLIDNLGKVVYHNEYKSLNAVVETSNLDNGVYYLKIIIDSSEHIEKVVINH